MDPWGELVANLEAQGHALAGIPHNLRQLVTHPRNYLTQLKARANQQAANSLQLLHLANDPTVPPQVRQAAAQQVGSMILNFNPMAMGIVKMPGGNWLSGAPESALKPLLKDHLDPTEIKQAMEADLQAGKIKEGGRQHLQYQAHHGVATQRQAVNQWINKQLTRYVKNDLGTARDPVRALAEQGTLHYEPADPNGTMAMMADSSRQAADGLVRTPMPDGPGARLGQNDLAKAWENASDAFLRSYKAGELSHTNSITTSQNPWLANLDPATPVYGQTGFLGASHLGFNHLTDELHNVIDPNSGLPANLRLTPEKLSNVSVPQAVQLVDKINKWRAAQAADANLKLANNPATQVLKQYDTIPGTQMPNARGLHWVELKQPNGVEVDPIAPNRNLEEALKYEGDQMGHCVGGYCPDVQQGESRIFSLRDAKGVPHVTVETQPPGVGVHAYEEYVNAWVAADLDPSKFSEWYHDGNTALPEPANKILKNLPSSIVQIKGKANKAPNPEYLPFVQDFVRSQGPWSDIQDQQNAGLTSDQIQAILQQGTPTPVNGLAQYQPPQ